MPTPTTRRATSWPLTVLLSLCLTCLFLRVASHRIGIDPYDESIYLFLARFFSWGNFVTHQAWSPLYIAWYRGLSHLCPNPITRYFLSWALLAGVIAMVPSLLRVRHAWLYTCLLVSLPALIAGPYLSLFAAAIFVTGMCVLLQQGRGWSYSSAGVMACGLSFVAAFVRPEYVYSVFLSAAVTLALLVWERGHTERKGVALTKFLVVASLAVAMQWVSHRSAGDNRSGFAFVQHYNLRAIEDGKLDPREGLGSQYTQRTFNLDVGRDPQQLTHTIGDFFRARPSLFLHHVLENAFDRRTLLLVGFLFIAIAWPWIRSSGVPCRPASLYLACICLPPIMGSLILYPRDHYATILIPSLMLLLLQAIPAPQAWSTLSTPIRAGIVVLLLAVLAGCARLSIHRLRQPPFTWNRENAERVRCAQAVDDQLADQRTVAFDSAVDLRIYVRHLREPVDQGTLPDLPRFKTWVTAQHPVWLAIVPTLADQYGTSPETIDHFLQAERGYTPHPCSSAANLTVYTEPAQ